MLLSVWKMLSNFRKSSKMWLSVRRNWKSVVNKVSIVKSKIRIILVCWGFKFQLRLGFWRRVMDSDLNMILCCIIELQIEYCDFDFLIDWLVVIVGYDELQLCCFKKCCLKFKDIIILLQLQVELDVLV